MIIDQFIYRRGYFLPYTGRTAEETNIGRPGGAITFSLHVNVGDKPKSAWRRKLREWRIWLTAAVKAWVSLDRSIENIIVSVSEETDQQMGYTLSKGQRGRYVGIEEDKEGNPVYDENGEPITTLEREVSYTITLAGAPSELLDKIGKLIRDRFSQQSVLVQDFNRGKSYILALSEGQEQIWNPEPRPKPPARKPQASLTAAYRRVPYQLPPEGRAVRSVRVVV